MKQIIFATVLLMFLLASSLVLAEDFTGKYFLKEGDVEGDLIITKSEHGYIARVSTFIINAPTPGKWSYFEGEGTFKDNILTVSAVNNGHSLQFSIELIGNQAIINEDSVKGDELFFSGPSGGPCFTYIYTKQ